MVTRSPSRRFPFPAVCLLAGSLAAGAVLHAQPRTVDMGEVTVTATRTEKSLEDVPLSLAVVTAEQIQRSPAVTVADLLKDLPGVQLHEASAPGAPRVYIRGETGNRVLVLVDGRRISEQKSMKGPVLLESAAGVERIEVVQGPASVLYGSEAIAGVVNIITKRSSSRPVSASLDAGYDSATDGWTRQATVSGTVQGLEYRLTGAGADHQDRETPDGTLDNTAFLYEDYSAYAGYRSPSGDLHLGLNVERYRSDVDSWVPVMSPPITYFYLDLPAWDRDAVSAFVDLRDPLPSLLRARLDLYWQETRKEFINDMDISLPNVPFPPHLTTQQIRGYSENDLDSYGAQLQLDWGLGESHHLITGLDWILDDMSATDDQTMTMTSTFPPLNTGTTRTVYDYEGTQESVAAFAQDEWSLAPDWALTLGSRWTWVETKLQDTDDPALVEDSERHSESVFALGLVNTSLDDWAFRGHVSQGFRVANLQQLYIGTIHGDRIPTFPNPDLDPETSQNAELGARYSGERLALDTAVFYSEADDYITAQMTGPATRQYVNISESTAFGAELSLACNLNPGQDLDIEPYIQGTWLRRRFDDGATSTYDSGRPLLSGRFGVRSTWRASADATAWADLYMRAADEADDANANTSTPGWSTLNLALGLTLGPNPETDTGTSAVRWRFVAGVENIGDRKYASAADREFTADMEAVPAPGRNVFVKVGCDF